LKIGVTMWEGNVTIQTEIISRCFEAMLSGYFLTRPLTFVCPAYKRKYWITYMQCELLRFSCQLAINVPGTVHGSGKESEIGSFSIITVTIRRGINYELKFLYFVGDRRGKRNGPSLNSDCICFTFGMKT
jgi:hypothetical protein